MLTLCVTLSLMQPTLTHQQWKKKIGEWLQDDYYFLPEKVKKKYLITGVGYAGGCLFPNANIAQLRAICRFCLWAFTIDDSFEFSTVSELKIICQKALAYLQGAKVNADEPLYGHLPLLRKELLRLSSEDWLTRFNTSLAVYFDGIQQEIPFRKNLIFPTWDQFFEIREKSVNVYPLINIAELITGTVLPNRIAEHPFLKEIEKLTCRILSWSNDYFSAHMEKGKDVLNIVLMIENEKQCTMDDAYRMAIDLHNQDLNRFCVLKDSLPDFGYYTSNVIAYIDNLSLMIHGHLHWRLTFTKRYDTLTAGHPSTELKGGKLSINI